jgi:hypothetical protein
VEWRQVILSGKNRLQARASFLEKRSKKLLWFYAEGNGKNCLIRQQGQDALAASGKAG